MTRSRMLFVILLCSFWASLFASETDQFSLPPVELLDLGPVASQQLYAVIKEAIDQTNAEIRGLLLKAKTHTVAAKKLVLLQQGDRIAHLINNHCGPGYPHWLQLKHSNPPMQYSEFLPWKKVYWLVFSQVPSHFKMAPTIRLYDFYLGADKLTHFFMFGYKYYKIYNSYLAKNKTEEEAKAAMVRYGELLEKTVLGTLLNGIYSNGDLVANYAGWKFYKNLTQEIHIGKKILPPILTLHDGLWEFSPHIQRDTLIKPYLSDGLNEAWNPSHYSFSRGQLQKMIKQRCADWISQSGITSRIVQAKLQETSTWHGEPYGHWLPKKDAVTLELCFS